MSPAWSSARVRVLGGAFVVLPVVTHLAHLAGLMTAEQMDALITLEAVLLSTAVAIASGLGGVYIWYVYRQRAAEAPFLAFMYRLALVAALAGVAITAYIPLQLLGVIAGRPWSSLWFAFWIAQLVWGAAEIALLWRRERRLEAARKDRESEASTT